MLQYIILPGVIYYDDPCHLKKFSKNPSICKLTKVSERMADMQMICKRFRLKNHVDAWCTHLAAPSAPINWK
jgi:hypothetical protein